MENLRWILIIAGVGILIMLYFSGRPKRAGDQREALDKSRGSSRRVASPQPDDPYPQADNFDDLADVDGVYNDAQAGYQHVTGTTDDPLLANPNVSNAHFDDIPDLDPDDFVRPGTGELKAENSHEPQSARASIAQKIESFSSRLSLPKQNSHFARCCATRSCF